MDGDISIPLTVKITVPLFGKKGAATNADNLLLSPFLRQRHGNLKNHTAKRHIPLY